MRKLLLAGVVMLALTGTAHAQIPVTDIALNTQTIANAIKDASYWAKQAADMAQQYQQAKATYEALHHATDLGGVLGILGGASNTYLPAGSEIPGLLTGASGLWGQGGQFFDQGQLYAFGNEAGALAEEMKRRQTVTANAQAITAAATTGYQQHLQNLSTLQARLSQASDVTEVDAVNGLIAIEQQNLEAHKGLIEATRVALAADDRVTMQRAEQQRRKEADDLFNATSAVTGSIQ
jgi:Type IV secretion system proteins